MQVRARAIISPEPRQPAGWVRLTAPGIGLVALLDELSPSHPLTKVIAMVLEDLEIARPPAMNIRITSTIPVASGLGSSAAVSISLIRALSGFLGHPLPDRQVSEIAFEVEKVHHGTPSGVDNTVITYRKPVYFARGETPQDNRIEPFTVRQPFYLVIGDSGVPSSTTEVVGIVRRNWLADPDRFNDIFNKIGELVRLARLRIESGEITVLGSLMNENHALLCEMGVSSKELDNLVAAALRAGAVGAKLSGGGRGGNMIALVTPELSVQVGESLLAAGAKDFILTTVGDDTLVTRN
jgi:mevalonate kinase